MRNGESPNQRASLDAAIAFCLYSERHWHRASEPDTSSSDSVEFTLAAVASTAVLSGGSSPPNSCGENSAVDCAIQGSAAVIVGPSC